MRHCLEKKIILTPSDHFSFPLMMDFNFLHLFFLSFISTEMNYHLVQSQINSLNLPVIVAWIGHYLTDFVRQRAQRGLPVLFYDWWPSPLTLNHNFTQIKFPSCPYDPDPVYCNFKLNQLTKMTSPALATVAPQAYEAVSRMSFTQDEYADLLQFYSNAKSLRPSIRASKVACSWVKEHENIWKQWFPKNISTRKKIYLGGLFPLSGPFWTQPGLVQSEYPSSLYFLLLILNNY